MPSTSVAQAALLKHRLNDRDHQSFRMNLGWVSSTIPALAGAGALIGWTAHQSWSLSNVFSWPVLGTLGASALLLTRHVAEVNDERRYTSSRSAYSAYVKKLMDTATWAMWSEPMQSAFKVISEAWKTSSRNVPDLATLLALTDAEIQEKLANSNLAQLVAQAPSITGSPIYQAAAGAVVSIVSSTTQIMDYQEPTGDFMATQINEGPSGYADAAVAGVMALVRNIADTANLPELMQAGITIRPDNLGTITETALVGHASDAVKKVLPLQNEIFNEFYQAYRTLDIPFIVQVQLPLAGFALSTVAWYVMTSAASVAGF